MALLKRKNSGHLQASTLLETLMGLVLIMLSFGVGMLIYEQVMHSSTSSIAIQHKLSIESAHVQADALHLKEAELADIDVERSVEPYPSNPKIQLVTYTTYDEKGEEIASWQTLIPTTP